MAKICSLINTNEESIYPQTITSAVYTADGNTLSDKLENIAMLGSPTKEHADIKIINANYLNNHSGSYFSTKEEFDKLNAKMNDTLDSMEYYAKNDLENIPVEEQIKYKSMLVHSTELSDNGIGYWAVITNTINSIQHYISQIAIGENGMAYRFIKSSKSSDNDINYIVTNWIISVSKDYLSSYPMSKFIRLKKCEVTGGNLASGFIKISSIGVEITIGFSYNESSEYAYITASGTSEVIEKDLYIEGNILNLTEFDGTINTVYRFGLSTIDFKSIDTDETIKQSCIIAGVYMDGKTYFGYSIQNNKLNKYKMLRYAAHGYSLYPLVTYAM